MSIPLLLNCCEICRNNACGGRLSVTMHIILLLLAPLQGSIINLLIWLLDSGSSTATGRLKIFFLCYFAIKTCVVCTIQCQTHSRAVVFPVPELPKGMEWDKISIYSALLGSEKQKQLMPLTLHMVKNHDCVLPSVKFVAAINNSFKVS